MILIAVLGHMQACPAFIARLFQEVETPPIVTILASDPSHVSRFQAQFAKYQLKGYLQQLIRYLPVYSTYLRALIQISCRIIAIAGFSPDLAALKDAYRTLNEPKSLQCAKTSVVYPSVPPPTIVIFDVRIRSSPFFFPISLALLIPLPL